MGWPYGEGTREDVRGIIKAYRPLKESGVPSAGMLVLRTVLVIAIGMVPLYGVVVLQWEPLTLLALFYCEGLIALILDLVRVGRVRATSKTRASQLLATWRWLAGIHHFAAFCLLLFLGPRGSPAVLWVDWIVEQIEIVTAHLGWPLLFAVAFQLAGLLDDFAHDRAHTTAGSYATLLFFAPLLALAFGWAGQPQFAALVGITACRLIGQSLWVWIVPIYYRTSIHYPRRN